MIQLFGHLVAKAKERDHYRQFLATHWPSRVDKTFLLKKLPISNKTEQKFAKRSDI